jgi:hypothetical protein
VVLTRVPASRREPDIDVLAGWPERVEPGSIADESP